MKWFIKAFRQYADFSGRAGRRELWMFVLFNLLFALAWGFAASLLSGLFGYSFSQGSDRLLAIYYSATAVPAMALGVRRLHDTGRSGWWLLVSLVPLVGGIWFIVLMCLDGSAGGNRYGSRPDGTTGNVPKPALRQKALMWLTAFAAFGTHLCLFNLSHVFINPYYDATDRLYILLPLSGKFLIFVSFIVMGIAFLQKKDYSRTVGGCLAAAYALQLILEIWMVMQVDDFNSGALYILHVMVLLAFILYSGLLLARKGRLPLTDYVLMAASGCEIILTQWSIMLFYDVMSEFPNIFSISRLTIIVPLSLFAYAIANRLTVEQKTQTEPLDIRNLNAPPASQLFEDKSDEGAKSFLGGLSSAERVRVSGLNPILYHAVIKEKKGEETPDIIMEDQSALSLIRRLRIDELEQLSASVEAAQEGDRTASSNMSRAATCYKKAADINPYNDTALMSYGCALANQGNLREGVKWVEKAVKVNPANERAKRNLQGIKRNL